jgi:hypothetical protein
MMSIHMSTIDQHTTLVIPCMPHPPSADDDVGPALACGSGKIASSLVAQLVQLRDSSGQIMVA